MGGYRAEWETGGVGGEGGGDADGDERGGLVFLGADDGIEEACVCWGRMMMWMGC